MPLFINPFNADSTKWSPTNCLSVFDHFMGLALKGLMVTFHVSQYLTETQNIKSFHNIVRTLVTVLD